LFTMKTVRKIYLKEMEVQRAGTEKAN
jgi:hypothetical protein